MRDELVGLEVALLARDCGFDEVCYYLHHPIYGVVDNSMYHRNSKLNITELDKTDYVTAPTQTLVQSWLRKLDFDVYVKTCFRNDKKYYDAVIEHSDMSTTRFSEGKYYPFLKYNDKKYIMLEYEEAMEFGLLSVLKYLKDNPPKLEEEKIE